MLKTGIIFFFICGVFQVSGSVFASSTAILNFGLSENGIEVLPQVMDYKITSGHLVQLGDISFDLDKSAPDFGGGAGAPLGLRFTWPTSGIPEGLITLRDYKTEEVIYKLALFSSPKDKKVTNKSSSGGHLDTLDEEKIPLDVILGQLKHRLIRVCIESTAKDLQSRLCSAPYDLRFEKNEYSFFDNNEDFHAHVKVDGQKVGKAGSAETTLNGKSSIEIQSDIGSQIVVEFSKVFVELDSIHLDKKLFLFGHDLRPKENVVNAEGEQWKAEMTDGPQPSLLFPEKNGFFIRQPFKLNIKAPPLGARYVMDPHSLGGTYTNHLLLHGTNLPDYTVSSVEREAHIAKDPRFDWDADAPVVNEINKRQLQLKAKTGENYLGTYDLYRGRPFEVIGNLTLPFTSTYSLQAIGEFTVSGWIEQLFKWENSILSVQRWGASVEGVVAIGHDSLGNSTSFTVIDADLKYSLTQGIWNDNSMFGPLLSYQSGTYAPGSMAMMGAGAFWNQKLPKGISRFLNFGFNFFDHPKWINLQGEYYFSGMTSGMTMGTNYNISGEYKVFLTPRFFTQLGLGYRQYYFSNSAFLFQIGIVQLSLGAGIDF